MHGRGPVFEKLPQGGELVAMDLDNAINLRDSFPFAQDRRGCRTPIQTLVNGME